MTKAATHSTKRRKTYRARRKEDSFDKSIRGERIAYRRLKRRDRARARKR